MIEFEAQTVSVVRSFAQPQQLLVRLSIYRELGVS